VIRLGLRLALAGGRGAVAGLALTATAVAVGTAILLFALSFAPAVGERDSRTAWRDSYIQADDGVGGTLVAVFEDRTDGQLLIRVHVAPSGDGIAPVPPAIAAMPGPGEAFVSPALAARMAALPTDQLAVRIGRVVGTIGDGALASPDELLAVIGTEPDVLRAYGAPVVSGYATEAAALDLPPIGALIVVLAGIGAMAPVAVFVATATRMSAARRELRLAALRLVGATPAQVSRLAVVEALIATSTGALVGVLLFFAVRPLIARIPLDETTWWPATIVPPLLPALGLLVMVQVVGAAGALVTMRRLTIGPLGVQRRTVPPAPRAGRVVPLLVSIAALMGAISLYRARDLPEIVTLGMAGLAFAGVIGGIAFAGPWLTGIVGRALHRFAPGGASLLAARRLGDDPRGSFGAIAGVIMAVFVASAFFTFTAYARSQQVNANDPLLRPNGIVTWLGNGSGLSAELADRLAQIAGVTAAVPIREVGLLRGDGFEAFAWVASCPNLVPVLALDGATCAKGGVNTLSAPAVSGRYTLTPDRSDPTGATPPRAELDVGPAPPPLVAASIPAETQGLLPQLLVDPLALDDPAAAAALPVTRIHVATDGSPGVAERVRSAVSAAAPAAYVQVAQDGPLTDGPFEEIGRIVAIGLLGTLALAGCSLAVAVTTATLERRRQFVFLRSAGMSAATLRATILLQAGVPLVTVAAASSLLGAIVGVAVISIAGGTVALPDVSMVAVLAASLAVAMLIVALTLPPLERMTRPASLRHE
jgi:FtsX-like permease family protein